MSNVRKAEKKFKYAPNVTGTKLRCAVFPNEKANEKAHAPRKQKKAHASHPPPIHSAPIPRCSDFKSVSTLGREIPLGSVSDEESGAFELRSVVVEVSKGLSGNLRRRQLDQRVRLVTVWLLEEA